MSSKQPKPVLTGQRLRSRKRDEKTKYDASSFRDSILEGLIPTEGDLDSASKFLDAAGNSLDYRRYSESLFDCLIAGGILAPGGSLVDDSAPTCPVSCFSAPATEDDQKAIAQVFRNVVRRYKYLQIPLEEEMTKILKFLAGFSEENRKKLALLTSFFFSMSLTSTKPLESLLVTPAVVKSNTALDFVTLVLKTWLKNSTSSNVVVGLRKGGMDGKLLEFLPRAKQNLEAFVAHCKAVGGLDDIIAFQTSQQSAEAKKELAHTVVTLLEEETPLDKIVEYVRDSMEKNKIPDHRVAPLIWRALMNATEWPKKADLVVDHALRHVKANISLLTAVCESNKAQVELIVAMQLYCYENQSLLKGFQRIVLLLYKGDVLGEDAVLEWNDKAHSPKGKSVFLAQMKKMVDWLNSAEEESSDEEDE